MSRTYKLEGYFNTDDTHIQFEVPDTRWGDECRVEIRLISQIVGPGEVKITTSAQPFEGTSEDSDDLEDEGEITFTVGGWREDTGQREIRLINTDPLDRGIWSARFVKARRPKPIDLRQFYKR